MNIIPSFGRLSRCRVRTAFATQILTVHNFLGKQVVTYCTFFNVY